MVPVVRAACRITAGKTLPCLFLIPWVVVQGHPPSIVDRSFQDSVTTWMNDARRMPYPLIRTMLIVGCITILCYVWAFRRRRGPATPRTETIATTATTSTNEGTNHKTSTTRLSRTPHDAALRLPPHVAVDAAVVAEHGANLLHDGVVAFRFTTAAAVAVEERRDRAQLWARLLLRQGSQPPKKGSLIVLAIPIDTVDCPHQRYGLYLLATYYNLMVVLVQPPQEESGNATSTTQEQRREEAMARLRGDASERGTNDDGRGGFLSSSVLPSHRILSATTVAGRVALCRQLQSVDLILDYDAEVQSVLSRFGHVVVLYNTNSQDGGNTAAARSEFGKLLLPL